MTRNEALAVAKPILFNTDMVRAIQDGTKTVTRRSIKPPYYIDDEDVCRKCGLAMRVGINATNGMHYPDSLYHIGDILYVRETWQQNYDGSYSYRAGHKFEKEGGWKPSIHMPKEAARIFLRVTDVRVERLQDITLNDMTKDFNICPEAISAVGKEVLAKEAWNSTVKKSDLAKYGWAANPWVWVIEFERIEVTDNG